MRSRDLCLAAALLATIMLGNRTADAALPDQPMRRAEAAMDVELSEPFCYFNAPSDVLGFMDCPEGVLVTPDADYQTGFGVFRLYAGPDWAPLHRRVRTLHRGYLPIIEYGVAREGLDYRVQSFAAPSDLDPRANLVSFIRITVSNPTEQDRAGAVAAAFLPLASRDWHDPACEDWYRDRFMDPADFAAKRAPGLERGGAWRGDHLVFTYPVSDELPAILPDAQASDSPAVAYHFTLPAGASREFTFRLPYVPVARAKADAVAAVMDAGYDDYLARMIAFWENTLAGAVRIELPDDKVVHTMRASLIYDLIARDITADGEHYVQKVNEFQYDRFYPRDSAYFVRTYDLLGLHEIAAQTVDHFLIRDESGVVTGLRRMMPDDWGQSLWAIGAHFRSSGDIEFARMVFPALAPHLDAFEQACAEDPLGLWPAAGPYDNEAIHGHYTGHSFWALLGLREAAHLADAIGETVLAERCRTIHDDYRQRFMKRLLAVAQRAEGYIPPGLDDPSAGYDWANASGGIYPFGVLDPHDPMVTATLEMVREYKYREGIMTYGPNAWFLKQRARQNRTQFPGWLHHYETIYLLETLLIRGEQRKVIEDFYSLLAHTGSTHSGFEFSILPYGDRDPGRNRTPHGWFAARFQSLLRNMLLREEGEAVHLLSAVAPHWLAPGTQIRVRGGATLFGGLSYTVNAADSAAEVVLDAKWRRIPDKLVLHVPWFLNVRSVEAYGGEARLIGDRIECEPNVFRLLLHWQRRPQAAIDHPTAVKTLLEKYYLRPERADYAFLFPTPRPPQLVNAHDVFTDELQVALYVPGGVGEIHYTLDGSPPTAEAPRYDGPFTITETTRLRAVTVWPARGVELGAMAKRSAAMPNTVGVTQREGATPRVSAPLDITLKRTSPRPPDEREGVVNGLSYEVYSGDWRSLPDFAALSPDAAGHVEAPAPAAVQHSGEKYAIRFAGYLEVPATGIYTFFAECDDGCRITIGNTVVVDHYGMHLTWEDRGAIALAAGRHAITIDVLERAAPRTLNLRYAGPGIAKQPIPATAFQRPAN